MAWLRVAFRRFRATELSKYWPNTTNRHFRAAFHRFHETEAQNDGTTNYYRTNEVCDVSERRNEQRQRVWCH